MRRLSLCIILTASVLVASAQVSVEAVIDSIQIFVGQQAHVTLTATAKENYPRCGGARQARARTAAAGQWLCVSFDGLYDDLVRRYTLLYPADDGEDRRQAL